ncbi:UDP-N-acetylmuramate dehydrogenase [Chitinimonas sp. BJB300]|uniref:UDP-N-acetylmuramate dehydrogenase n=1 Tax=Chitinimonas sp. BJB300 TaxID=1559339 RepID=UPI000C0D2EC0|nr:UDP-N-acetylmuramate dehydrogenase [Chitinimonas sp. BJB300]PHV12200.1 UDP-N-acetylenolpyruvoylglucosamine reductase [Chitinimonas sp. BJB300]TSJ91605.1 UDP-N-acetylmuramate dehydrogenase [Chitinimonas sp. BJB300]
MPPHTACDLAPLHTLGLHAQARHLVHFTDNQQLEALLAEAERPLRVLGSGSNLVPGEMVDGTVIRVELTGRTLLGEDEDAWYVAAAAGESWHEFVQWTLAQGWPGLENLSLIPGTVGAAPIQNIGAYGVELKDRFHGLAALNLEDGSTCLFTPDHCDFGYRDSIFKQGQAGRWLITEVLFRLPKQWEARLDYGDLRSRLEGREITPQAVAEAVVAMRQSKLPDPAVIGNAGSFFHNPVVSSEQAADLRQRFPDLVAYPQPDGRVKLAAGWLIEQVGWKGRQLGPVGMYEKQALVMVNHGGASAADVKALMQAVQADVMARFGVPLSPEPIWW